MKMGKLERYWKKICDLKIKNVKITLEELGEEVVIFGNYPNGEKRKLLVLTKEEAFPFREKESDVDKMFHSSIVDIFN